jgi:iron complex outermembrane receptor protein
LSLGGGWSLRGSIGTGFSAPTPFLDETERNGLGRLLPLAGVRAERAVSGSIDGHGAIGPVEINASIFVTRVADPLQMRPAGNGDLYLVNGDGSTRTGGADLSLVIRRGETAVTASYAFVASSEPDPDGTGRRTIPLTPRHAAGLVAVREGDWGRVGLELYYTGRQALERNPFRSVSSPYLVVGVLAERRFGRHSGFLNLENLTDLRQTRFDPLIRPTRAPDGSWTVDAWAPLEGRTVNGGIRWAW